VLHDARIGLSIELKTASEAKRLQISMSVFMQDAEEYVDEIV